jgi:hypothetical protein
MRLPMPTLIRISDPHVDLVGHLKRHGLREVASDCESASGITVEYLLEKWVRLAAPGGPIYLLNESNIFLNEDRCGSFVRDQVRHAQLAQGRLPKSLSVPLTHLSSLEAHGVLPDRMLAIYGRDPEEKGILIPAHTILYVLQCLALPSFDTKVPTQDGKHTMSITPVCLPYPRMFPPVHRFIYTHDRAALLNDILPIRFIARYCQHHELEASLWADKSLLKSLAELSLPNDVKTFAFADEFVDLLKVHTNSASHKSSSVHAIEALSQLASGSLLKVAFKIRSIYANGMAIGFREVTFWRTLQKAWALIVAALGVKRCRSLAMQHAVPQ